MTVECTFVAFHDHPYPRADALVYQFCREGSVLDRVYCECAQSFGMVVVGWTNREGGVAMPLIIVFSSFRFYVNLGQWIKWTPMSLCPGLERCTGSEGDNRVTNMFIVTELPVCFMLVSLL